MNLRNTFLALGLFLAAAVRLGSQSMVLDVDQLPVEGPPARKEILSVLMDGQGFIWIGSQAGLARYDGYRVVPCRIDEAGESAAGGLPVRAMCEGPAGRLWLATDRGLVRYDSSSGQTVRFRHDPGKRDTLSTDDITCLHIAPALPGRLWIAGENGALDELDLDSGGITRHTSNFTASGGMRPERIMALGSDPAGILWIGAADGLYRYLPQEGLLRSCPLPESVAGRRDRMAVTAIQCDPASADNLWIGSDSAGLFRYRPASGLWERCREEGPRVASGDLLQADLRIHAIVLSPETQTLLIGTDNGLYRYFPQSGRCSTQPLLVNGEMVHANRFIQSLYRDPQGGYWIGSRDDGLAKWRPMRKPFYRHAPFGDDGAARGGLHAGPKPNPLANWVTAIQNHGDNGLLLTTYGGGALVFDRKTLLFRPLPLVPGKPGLGINSFITDCQRAPGGDLWFSTMDGLAHCTAAGKLIRLHGYPPGAAPGQLLVFSLVLDRQGVLWLGSDQGLLRFAPREGTWRRDRHLRSDSTSLSNDHVNAILQDAGGDVWIGTDEGLNLYLHETGRFSVFKNDPKDPASISSSQVNSLTQDSLGRIWVCTNNGLNLLSRKKGRASFRRFLFPGGDPGKNLFRCLVEENAQRFWAGTNAGLARFDSERGTFTYYDRRDGVEAEGLNEVFFGWRSRDGEIFFGGRFGFIRFRPAEIALNRHPPMVEPIGYRIYNSRDEAAAGGLLPFLPQVGSVAGEKVVRIEFAALDFARPEKNQYAYRLEGRDQDWIYQGYDRVVILAGLRLGRHRLRIRAANNEGVWNEISAVLPIHVRLSFWERWRFPILAVALLALLAAVVLWRRRRSHRLRKASVPENLDAVAEKFSLSRRETEILRLLLAGKSNKEIEDALFIAMATVKIHVHNIFRKVKVGSRLQLLLRIQQEADKFK